MKDKRYETSSRMNLRAHEVIPGAAHTYAKGDDQFPEQAPSFIERGKGCHVWDVDGNEFIEYGMGLRSVTLGHAYEPIVEAAYQEMRKGMNFGRPSPLELRAAEKLLELIPCAEMAKFAKNGSDVTTAAVKLSRAYTGRDKVAICRDHPFFSVDDWFIGSTKVDAGVPRAIKELTVNFAYNDADSLENVLDAFPGQIACVILEVEKEQPPKARFLERVRSLCDQHGCVLIFDEIITGFRVHLSGAQALYEVTPDLATFGKAMGNGFPLAALVGKRELMRLGGLKHSDERVFLLSTTSGAETCGLGAGLKVMEIYETENVVQRLYQQGEKLQHGARVLAKDAGVEGHFGVRGLPCNMVFYTCDSERKPSQSYRTLFMQEMIKRGVIAPSFVISYSHSDEDVNRTLDAIEGALAVYKKALDNGSVKGLLTGRPVQPVYRAFN